MRAEIEALAQDIQRSVALLKRHLDWDAALMRLDELNALAENPDLWNELLNLAAPHSVQFIWVRGHGSNQGNARCDELAVAARCVPNLPTDPGYGQPFSPTPAATPTPTAAPAPAQPTQLSLFDA